MHYMVKLSNHLVYSILFKVQGLNPLLRALFKETYRVGITSIPRTSDIVMW
jgi:hypothetical protein